MSNNKLPEVGEFWETFEYRHKVLFVDATNCLCMTANGSWVINKRSVMASCWRHLHWCKSFDDAEPKPVSEEIEFREYICGQELKWLYWTPSNATPTGAVRKVKVSK